MSSFVDLTLKLMRTPTPTATTPTAASTTLRPQHARPSVGRRARGGGDHRRRLLARWRASVSSISLMNPWARWMSSGGSLVPMRRYSAKLLRAGSS